MDWQVREIEKYYLTKKDPKFLYKNVEHMTPQELRDIVNIFIYIIYIINIYLVQKKFYSRKKDQRRINERNQI